MKYRQLRTILCAALITLFSVVNAVADTSKPNFSLFPLVSGQEADPIAERCYWHKKKNTIECVFFATGKAQPFYEPWEGEWGHQLGSGKKWRVRDRSKSGEPGSGSRFMSWAPSPSTDQGVTPGFDNNVRKHGP
jgi:hypothetical protein